MIDDSYQPSPRDLKWYEEWTLQHRRLLEIAREDGASLADVTESVRKVSDWVRQHSFYTTDIIRDRQTELLDHLASRCLRDWDGKTMAPIEQARKLMSDLRDIWFVGKLKSAETDEVDNGLFDIDGMDRIQALRHQAATLQRTADAIERAYSKEGAE